MPVRNVAAIILAGGQGERLSVLSAQRAKPAVPFAGKYRIIDFTLSNCVNSGLYRVAVLTQYRPHSLNDHIERGRPWDLDRSFTGGVQILQPYKGRYDTDWYSGTLPYAITNSNWHQVVVIYDGTTLTLYLDGQSVGTASFSDRLGTLTDSNGLILGRDTAGSGNWVTGSVDEAAVYATALTGTQVLNHFSASGWSRPASFPIAAILRSSTHTPG